MITYPKISIVTISYNQGNFLEETIKSVLSQGYEHLEYIIIDGFSKDNSREIIKKYESQLAYWVSEPDNGPADALNKGFSHATGDIYYYLNADDVLLPGALRKIAQLYQDRPAFDVYYGNAFLTDVNLRITGLCISDEWNLQTYLAGHSIIIQQGTFMRKEAFHKTNGFNVQNRTCWDGELVVDLSVAGAKFCRVDEYFAFFRIHGESITGSDRLRKQYLQDKKRMKAAAQKVNHTTPVKHIKKLLMRKIERKLSYYMFRAQ